MTPLTPRIFWVLMLDPSVAFLELPLASLLQRLRPVLMRLRRQQLILVDLSARRTKTNLPGNLKLHAGLKRGPTASERQKSLLKLPRPRRPRWKLRVEVNGISWLLFQREKLSQDVEFRALSYCDGRKGTGRKGWEFEAAKCYSEYVAKCKTTDSSLMYD